MNETQTKTLAILFEELHTQRTATWRPEDLQVNVEQRASLLRTDNRAGFVKPGTQVESFNVVEAFGDILESKELLKRGPLVLVFFRFASCPACNIALPYYHRTLWPQLKELGASILALSPQIPERLIGIKLRLGMDFLVACDRDNDIARRFGILYACDEASQHLARSRNTGTGDIMETGTWELPMPTVVVVDTNGVVRFVDVSPDWLDRTESSHVIAAVRDVTFVSVRRPRVAAG